MSIVAAMRSRVGSTWWCPQPGQTRRFCTNSAVKVISPHASHLVHRPRGTDTLPSLDPASGCFLRRHHAMGTSGARIITALPMLGKPAAR